MKTTTESTKNTQKQEPSKEGTVTTKILAPETSQKKGSDRETEPNLKTPDERIVTFTLWLVIVACIQAAIFAAQWITMRIQAKRLRETVEATEKAAKAAELSTEAVVRIELPIIRAFPEQFH